LNLKKTSPLFLLTCFILCTNACRAAEVLQLVQNTTLGGIYDLYVSNNALKAVNRTSGFVMYSHAPAWQLLICNPLRKVYCTMPSRNFTGKMSHNICMIDPAALENLRWGVGKRESFKGLPAIHSRASITESEFRSGLDPRHANRVWKGEYIELEKQLIPATVCHALQGLYGLPLRDNIPLRVSYFDFGDGKKSTALETFICKRVKIDMNYSAPRDFKKVATEMDVCAAQEQQSEFDFLIRARSPN
jgi:hypothetical protein